MKLFRDILICVLISFIFASCKKNREPEPVTFSGTILNNVTGLPVEGVSVTIKLQQASNNNVFNAGFSTIANTTSDANGNYSVTFTPENPITYRIIVDKQYYFSEETELSDDLVPAGSTTDTDFGIDPLGWFKINIKNVAPNDVDDNIIYQNTSEASGCSSCCNNSAISLDGMTIDTFFICQRAAYPTITFNWFVTKNGNIAPFSNSVSAIHGDTVVYNLNY